jgi:hypothetical protein
VLSGTSEIAKLTKLINDVKLYSGAHTRLTGLSGILAEPRFLIAAWGRINFKKVPLRPTLVEKSTGGINMKWFLAVSNSIKNGAFQFQPSRCRSILNSGDSQRL